MTSEPLHIRSSQLPLTPFVKDMLWLRMTRSYIPILFFVMILVCPKNLPAQSWLWGRGNTGHSMDGWGVATDPAGNVFVAGISGNYGGTSLPTIFGSVYVPFSVGTGGSANYQCVVAKYDPNGNILWANGTMNANAWLINIATDRDGNLYLFGNFTSPSVQIGSFTLTNSISPSAQFFLVKFDPNGSILWARNGGNTQNTYWASAAGIAYVLSIGGIATDQAGNVYITANFKLPSITIGATILTNTDASGTTDDIFIAKYDPSGNVVWANSIGGMGIDDAYGITVTPAGDVYIAGVFSSPTINFGASTISNTSANQMAFIGRFNSLCTPVWATSSGSTNGSYGIGIASDESNNVYVTGGFKDADISFSGTIIARPYSTTAMYLVKLDPLNNVSWHKTMCSPTNDAWGYSIALSSCGYVWVSGSFGDSVVIDGHILHAPAVSVDPVYIAGFTNGGIYLGSSSLGGGADDQNGIACDQEGNVFLCSDYQDISIVIIGPDTLPSSGGGEWLYIGKYKVNKNYTPYLTQADSAVCREETTILRAASGYNNYVWSDSIIGPAHPVGDTGTFWVHATGNCDSSLVNTFRVSDSCTCRNNIFVPNTFTPNGDGENDVFYPRCEPAISKILSFRVYNRWGELLFDRENIEPNDITNAWDGVYKGQLQLPEVFVWVVDALCNSGHKFNRKGSVTVIR